MLQVEVPKLGDLDNFVYSRLMMQDNIRPPIEPLGSTVDTMDSLYPDELAQLFGHPDDHLLLHTGDIDFEDMRTESSQVSSDILPSKPISPTAEVEPAPHTETASRDHPRTAMTIKLRIRPRLANKENMPDTSEATVGPIRVAKRRNRPTAKSAKSPYASSKKKSNEEDSEIPLALKQPQKLVPIMCRYNGCKGTEEYCGTEAWREHLMRAHSVPASAKHGGECLYPNCNDPNPTNSFVRHIISRHSGVRFRCRQCEKLFSRPDAVKRHFRSSKCTDFSSKGVFLFDEICLEDSE